MRQIVSTYAAPFAASLVSLALWVSDGQMETVRAEGAVAVDASASTAIPVTTAIDEARDYFDGGSIESVQLTRDGTSGTLLWEITAGPEQVQLDALTGDLLEITFF